MLINPYRYAQPVHGTPALATPFASSALATVTTADFTPTWNDLLLAFGGGRASVAVSDGTCVDSLGSTWTPLIFALRDTGTGTRVYSRLFAMAVGASPAARNVTWGATGAVKCGLYVVRVPGAGPYLDRIVNVAAFDHGNGDPTPSLITMPTAGGLVVGGYFAGGTSAITEPSNYTELAENLAQTDLNTEIVYDDVGAAQSAAWSTGNAASVAILAEVL